MPAGVENSNLLMSSLKAVVNVYMTHSDIECPLHNNSGAVCLDA